MGLLINQYKYPAAAGGSLFLDEIPGAYYSLGLRQLRTAYSGPIIEIERSSDNAAKDFYPDGSGLLSMTSEDGLGTDLSTWIGANDGYVRTWYDQSGNGRDFTQTTYANQPQIISGGSFLTLGGNPCITTTSSDSLSYTLTTADWEDEDLTNFFCGAVTGLTSAVNSSGGSGYLWYDRSFSDMDFRHNGTIGGVPRPTSATQIIYAFFYDFSASQIEVWFDNSSQGTDTMDSNWTVTNHRLGGDANTVRFQEITTFVGDKSADIGTGSDNINAVYSTY